MGSTDCVRRKPPPSREHYEVCPFCGADPAGCRQCGGVGFIKTGITARQVERLVDAAQRLTWRTGDIARVRSSPDREPVIFVVTMVGDRGEQLAGEVLTHRRITLIAARAIDCIRVGRVDRKDGEPC